MTQQPQHSQVFKIAITGGIGSGKSFVCRSIEAANYPVFYCDDEAKRIIRNDIEVKTALIDLVGSDVYDPKGTLYKPALAAFICKGKDFATKVDAIVHPHVGKAFEKWALAQKKKRVFMECALLYESGFDKYVDSVIHVSAPFEVRLQRVMSRDNVSKEKALEWMALQMPEEEKAQRADFVILNNGKEDILQQIQQFIKD